MNEDEQKITREYLTELLHNNELKIAFEKKDGTMREMKCTLKEDMLPKRVAKDDTEKKPRKVNEEVLVVFDVEKQAFRSFRLDSLRSFGFTI